MASVQNRRYCNHHLAQSRKERFGSKETLPSRKSGEECFTCDVEKARQTTQGDIDKVFPQTEKKVSISDDMSILNQDMQKIETSGNHRSEITTIQQQIGKIQDNPQENPFLRLSGIQDNLARLYQFAQNFAPVRPEKVEEKSTPSNPV